MNKVTIFQNSFKTETCHDLTIQQYTFDAGHFFYNDAIAADDSRLSFIEIFKFSPFAEDP